MKKTAKIILFAASLCICMGAGASASAFSDMPDGEIGTALQHAVDAGLMNGVTDDLIEPNGNITRAQMATIITRAFGATENAEKKFNDVSDSAWYADAVSKAAAMGAFEGDDDNNFNPENNITFQETYAVLSRIFGFEPYQSSAGKMISDVDDSVLNSFTDASELASWAKNDAKYIVGNGGWTGIGGQLKPTSAVTRGEFALIMDSLVSDYIDEPGEYTTFSGGTVLVRSGGVTIKNLVTDKNLIITYGVDEQGCVVENSTVNGITLILGGIDKTLVEKTDSNGNVRYEPDESYVTISGKFNDVRVESPTCLNAQSVEWNACYISNGASVLRTVYLTQ